MKESLTDQAKDNWEEFKKRYIYPSVLQREWDLIVDCLFDGCYGFQMFTKEFCDKLIEEAEEKNSWGKERHSNTEYSTYDILLNDLNINGIYDNLLSEYVYQAIVYKFHLETIVATRPLHERFNAENLLAKYTVDGQGHLSCHHDFSAVSTVLTLNEDFEGGGTWFVNQQKLLKNSPGYMIFHPGMFSHYHGARPITSGTRYVVISFNNVK